MSEGLNFCIISDFFVDDFVGGAALNDEEIYNQLKVNGHNCIKVKSKDCTLDFLKNIKNYNFIVSNFFHLPDEVKTFIQDNLKYSVYAHDYKFVAHTNPARYEDFEVPKEELINVDFYNNSAAIVCQSSLQKRIYDLNLNVENKTKNFSGNLWNDKCFQIFEDKLNCKKNDKVAVVKSLYPEKGTPESIKLCINNGFDYEVIHSQDYYDFLNILGNFSAYSFVPFTPETLSRICVESKMMGLEIYTTNLVGATYEPWFSLKGEEMINEMKARRESCAEFMANLFT